MARPAVRNGRWLVAGAGGLVLAGVITYVATGSVTAAEHPVAQRPVSKPPPPAVVTVTPPDGAAMIAPGTRVQITASTSSCCPVRTAR